MDRDEAFFRWGLPSASLLADQGCRHQLKTVPAINAGTKPCDLKLEGADKLLKNLAGGLDGTYAVWSCENGRPLYKRESSPVGRAPLTVPAYNYNLE